MAFCHEDSILLWLNFANVRLPIPLLVIERIDEGFVCFEIVKDLSIFWNQVLYFLGLGLQRVKLWNQRLLDFQLVLYCALSIFGLFFDTVYEFVHKFNIILKIEFPCLQSLFLIFYTIL